MTATTYVDAHGATWKTADTIEVGDDIVFLGIPHRVVSIGPITLPAGVESRTGAADGWRRAEAAADWSFTLIPGDWVQVAGG